MDTDFVGWQFEYVEGAIPCRQKLNPMILVLEKMPMRQKGILLLSHLLGDSNLNVPVGTASEHAVL